MILTTLVLSFDMYILFGGMGMTRFAGIFDIWMHFDKTTIVAVENYFIKDISPDLWRFLIMPLLKFPAALMFGLPGFMILRNTRPEIALHVPTALEMEMMGQGMDSRQIRALKRRRAM